MYYLIAIYFKERERKMKKRKAYIYGAAKGGEAALMYCRDTFCITGFIDRRAGLEFSSFCSLPVISPNCFFTGSEQKEIMDIIVAVRYPAEIVNLIASAYNEDLKNINIYIFDDRNNETPLLYKVQEGEICTPEYMNKRFDEIDEYSNHYSRLNPFVLKMFKNAFDWISEYDKNIQICELGCGSGQFANMLFDNGYIRYTGIDFSSKAIEMARGTNPCHKNKFICENALTYFEKGEGNIKDTLFISFEMLEHMNRDIELCNMLPCGNTIIFSVPNFKSFNHMRTFNDLESIQSRYFMFEIINYLSLPASEDKNKKYHLVAAVKK